MKKCLAEVFELYEWELQKIPFVNSVVGRHVYCCVAKRVLSGNAENEDLYSIKSLFSTANFTDRAIRLKIREMESLGYLKSIVNDADKRSKKLIPTEDLIILINDHSEMLDRFLQRDFFIIEKK